MSRSYCFFSAQYLPTMGGVERYTYELAKELIARGNRVTVVTSQTGSLAARETSKEGIEIWRLPSLSLMNGRFPVTLPTPARRRLTAELKKQRFDLVVINTRFYPLSLYGAKFARQIGCPSLVIEHGSSHVPLGGGVVGKPGEWYEHMVTALLRRRCRDFYGVSRACCDWLSHFGITAKGTLYNAVDFAYIRRLCDEAKPHFRKDCGLSEDTAVIVYTGRLIEEKGALPLARAVRTLSKTHKVHLLIAGDGPLSAPLRTMDGDCVTLLGKLPFEEIVTLLRESDIYCLPSRYPEGFPTAYLEAVACRCFAVCMPVAGVTEVITDDRFGILIRDTQDPLEKTLENALEKALARTDRAACAERAYDHCKQRYTFARTADELEAIIRRIGR